MRRPVAAVFRVLDKAAAGRAVRLKFSAGGIHLDAGSVVIELQRKEASRIGWKRHRLAAHQFGKHAGRFLGIARGNREMVDHWAPLAKFRTRHSTPRRSA